MIHGTLKSLRVLGAVAGCALLAPAWGQGDATATKFLTDAIRGNIAEVRLGELAQQRGKSRDVRELGALLVSDHTLGLQKTSALATMVGVTLPTEASADAIRHYEAMSKLSGEAFDRAFASHMVIGHRQEIARYTEQSRDGGNPDVAELANDTLPTLQRHLAAAQSIDENLRAD